MKLLLPRRSRRRCDAFGDGDVVAAGRTSTSRRRCKHGRFQPIEAPAEKLPARGVMATCWNLKQSVDWRATSSLWLWSIWPRAASGAFDAEEPLGVFLVGDADVDEFHEAAHDLAGFFRGQSFLR